MSSRITYPRAMPLHAPDQLARKIDHKQDELAAQARQLDARSQELAARAERLKRWTACLLIAAGLVAGTLAFALSRFAQPAPAPVTESNTPPADIKPSAPSAAAQPEMLETLGSLSAAHLYQTHLNIGLLADGVETGTYTVAEAEESLRPVLDLMKQLDARLAKLTKSDISAEDRRAIQQTQAVSALLRLQADALRANWASGDMKTAGDFQEARHATWDGLAKVMGLER